MEQKAAHTAGPWSLTTVPTSAGSCHKIGPFPARRPGGAPTFACVYADGIRIGIDDGLPRAIELAANARLIAAAPDLLAACKSMIEWDDREKDHAVDFSARMLLCEAAFNAARAAIAKATGSAA